MKMRQIIRPGRPIGTEKTSSHMIKIFALVTTIFETFAFELRRGRVGNQAI